MTFQKTWTPKQAAPSFKNQLILSIGRRAFVNLPGSGAELGDFTPFGTAPAAAEKDPSDGQEVEIISWRPMGPQGLSYQVQRVSDRRQWWAKATCLRTSAAALSQG